MKREMQSPDLFLPSSQNNFVKHLGETPQQNFQVTVYNKPGLRKSVPTRLRWLLTEARKGTRTNSMRFGRHRIQGSTALLGQEGCCSMPPPSLANVAFCERHCLLPSGFGWKAGDFIARFDNEEIQCRHWTSGFCHCPPSEGMRSLFLWVRIKRILQWKRHKKN